MRYGFGVDLGGTTVKIAYFDEVGTMIDKWEIPTVVEHEGKQILPDIAASISQYIEKNHIDRNAILGVGIGVPGPVDGNGMVNKCVNLGWGKFSIVEALFALVGFPVKAANDANAAALGEYWKGGGQGCKNMILATLGTGVGGGIIIDGLILNGAHGSGAEIGHMVLNRNETEVCGCGKRGCVEQYCSATGLVRLAKNELNAASDKSQLRQYHPLTCKAVFDCAKAGDWLSNRVLDQYYGYLGEALANLCDLIDPDVVVLGGGVSKAGQVLLDGIRPYFDRAAFHAARGARFALATLGNDAGSYGAFKLALDAFGKIFETNSIHTNVPAGVRRQAHFY